jgi:hypothetical protein
MAERKPAKKGTQPSAKRTTGKASKGQSAQKFKTRYATFGFSDTANLDKGAMWPTSFALKKLTAAEEKKIGALVKKAVS